MEKGGKVINKPEWIKKLQRNAKARERYFKNHYGSLERMDTIDRKLKDKLDEWSAQDEMKHCE